MPRSLLRFLISLSILPVFLPTSIAEQQPAVRLGAVRRGMSLEEVRPLVGRPEHISRQILFRRHLEQWQFDEATGWIEWNCLRGEAPYVLQVQAVKKE